MKIKALNPEIVKYGYPLEMEYNKDDVFHGHQVGITLGIIDDVTHEIKQNYMPESHADKFEELIHNDSILKVEDHITQLEDNDLKPRTVLFAPYYVENHSVFKPTINYDNVDDAQNSVHHLQIECLLVYEGLSRYFTIKSDTVNVCIFDIVNDFFECDLPNAEYEQDDDYDTLLPGLKEDDGDEGYGWYLDFYDEAGQTFWIRFDDPRNLKEALVSMRLIDIVTEIK